MSGGRAVASSADVAELVDGVRRLRSGVICCGPLRAEASRAQALARFARAAGWPLLADPASGLRAGAQVTGAPILDTGDVLPRAARFAAAAQPEFVLRVGAPPVSKAQRQWIEASSPREVWWLDEGEQWGEPSRLATRVVEGGSADLLERAAVALERDPVDPDPWCARFESASRAARTRLRAWLARPEAWSGLAVAATLVRGLPADAALFASNSMAIRLLDLALETRAAPLSVYCNRGASGIDGVSSTALGVAAARGRRSFLLTGDLAFLHDLSGLLIARRERIPLTIVAIDDDGGGIFSFLPIAEQGEAVEFERLFHTPHGVDLAQAAALCGLAYSRVQSVDELEKALSQSSAGDAAALLHVRLDAKANVATFREALVQLADAVEASLSGDAQRTSDGRGGRA